MVWYGMVWYGMVWYGMVWYGIWYGICTVNKIGYFIILYYPIIKKILSYYKIGYFIILLPYFINCGIWYSMECGMVWYGMWYCMVGMVRVWYDTCMV
jgi:chloride channel 2